MIYLVLLYFVSYTHADIVKVTVDNDTLQMEWDKTQNYDGIATYFYTEGELVTINCTWESKGWIKFDVEGEKDLMDFMENKQIIMLMKMRTEVEGKHIDCIRTVESGKAVVRIIFKRKIIHENLDPWQIQINKVTWRERPQRMMYTYVRDEEVHVSCQAASICKGGFSYYLNTTESYHSMQCPNGTDGKTQMSFHQLTMGGIQGLRSSNILLWYDSGNRIVIHYEYGDDERLHLFWVVTAQPAMRNNFTVVWKKQQILSYTPLVVMREVNITIPTINVTGTDDRKIIEFWRSPDDSQPFPRGSIWIVLRRKFIRESDNERNSANDKLGFYTAIGGGIIILLLILMIIFYLIRRRIQKVHKNESQDNFYENLRDEDSSIPPFPSQWDAYATIMHGSNTNVRDLYAEPIPKRIREGKIPDGNYASISFPEREGLYSEVSVKSFNKDNAEGYVNVR